MPAVRISLINAVIVPPLRQAMVSVKAHSQPEADWRGHFYSEPFDCSPCYCEDAFIALLQPNGDGHAYIIVSNPTTLPQDLEQGGTCMGTATSVAEADVMERKLSDAEGENCEAEVTTTDVWRIDENQSAQKRMNQLMELIPDSCTHC